MGRENISYSKEYKELILQREGYYIIYEFMHTIL